MKIFADTAHVDEVRKAYNWGFIDGVTTNPSLVSETEREYKEVVEELDTFVDGPINVQVVATETNKMVEEGEIYDEWGDNISVKIPVTKDGMRAIQQLSEKGISTNATCLFSPVQALVAAKNGADYVSTWWGDTNDTGHNGFDLVQSTNEILEQYGFDTEHIVASVRNPRYIEKSARIGADIITVPPFVFDMFWNNSMTHQFLENILDDWGDRGSPI